MTVGATIQVYAWYDEGQDVIKLRIGGELTSVDPDPISKRGNLSLYKKLAAALRDAGKDYPAGVL